jgi:hypothetical protein
MWANYQRLRAQRPADPTAIGVQQACLAETAPHLLDEISKRDMVLTRVRQLIAGADGLYDLDPDAVVPVSAIRDALDPKENNV